MDAPASMVSGRSRPGRVVGVADRVRPSSAQMRRRRRWPRAARDLRSTVTRIPGRAVRRAARLLDGQQVVAGCDARAAVDDGRRGVGADRRVADAQRGRVEEPPVGVEVAGERHVQRAGDVSGARINRLGRAVVTLRRACVDDYAAARDRVRDPVGVDQSGRWPVVEVERAGHDLGRDDRQRLVGGGVSTVEQCSVFATSAEQPDQPRRGGATGVVDATTVAPFAIPARRIPRRRRRVVGAGAGPPPVWRPCAPRVEVDEHGSGRVPLRGWSRGVPRQVPLPRS